MNVLIIVPDRPELNLVSEIRDIQRRHNVQLLNGSVTKKDIYDWVREGRYNILHFAGHGGETGFWLSDGEVLTQEEIGQLCRMSHTLAVFANACNMVRVMTYLIQHGADVAVFASSSIPDDEAWQMPSVFYRMLQGDAPHDIVAAFQGASDSTGKYSIIIAPTFVERLMQKIRELTASLLVAENKLLCVDTDPVQVRVPKLYLQIGLPALMILYAILLFFLIRG